MPDPADGPVTVTYAVRLDPLLIDVTYRSAADVLPLGDEDTPRTVTALVGDLIDRGLSVTDGRVPASRTVPEVTDVGLPDSLVFTVEEELDGEPVA